MLIQVLIFLVVLIPHPGHPWGPDPIGSERVAANSLIQLGSHAHMEIESSNAVAASSFASFSWNPFAKRGSAISIKDLCEAASTAPGGSQTRKLKLDASSAKNEVSLPRLIAQRLNVKRGILARINPQDVRQTLITNEVLGRKTTHDMDQVERGYHSHDCSPRFMPSTAQSPGWTQIGCTIPDFLLELDKAAARISLRENMNAKFDAKQNHCSNLFAQKHWNAIRKEIMEETLEDDLSEACQVEWVTQSFRNSFRDEFCHNKELKELCQQIGAEMKAEKAYDLIRKTSKTTQEEIRFWRDDYERSRLKGYKTNNFQPVLQICRKVKAKALIRQHLEGEGWDAELEKFRWGNYPNTMSFNEAEVEDMWDEVRLTM